MKFFINLFLIIFYFNNSWAATSLKSNTEKFLSIKKASDQINIDGILNEKTWTEADSASDFFQCFPADTCLSKTKTIVKVTYDDTYIYVSAVCFDSIKKNYIVQSLKRDYSYPVSDAFAVFFDPFNDKINGFSFSVNPLGVQREGLISNGGGDGVTTAWDNKWYSKVKTNENNWVVEMAIPFKSIRYKENSTTWGINFSRNDLKINENSSWSPVPRSFNIASLAYTGQLKWDNPPKKAGPNISIIPYMIAGANQDFIAKSEVKYPYNAGLDAKIGITSSLNLDLTINPDFAQVEVDQQVTNLTRFNLFFPERRTFFIENSDLFEQFGFNQIRPFFSRNIGLAKGQVVPIIAGARLSGRINKNWRIGVMNLQTEKKSDLNVLSTNYTVTAFQRRLFRRSNISGIFVNQQTFTNGKFDANNFNRVGGLDFNFASANNSWNGKVFYHQLFTPNMQANNYAFASFLAYKTNNWLIEWNQEYVGENYNPSVGFTPRIYQFNPTTGTNEKRTYWRLEPWIVYKFYPKSKLINNHGPTLHFDNYFNAQGASTDYAFIYDYIINFQDASSFEFSLTDNFTKLNYSTDITFTGSYSPISAGNYYYKNWDFTYRSSAFKKLNGSINIDIGEYYIEKKYSYIGNLNYRIQPWGIIGLNFSHNDIYMPKGYSNATIDLIGTRIDISFTKSIFFTTFVQYNTQIQNVNINSRFQWRFKPMSDLYIVYSDNYDSFNFLKKNRAIVLKFVYWFNL